MSRSANINGSQDYPPLNYIAHLCPGREVKEFRKRERSYRTHQVQRKPWCGADRVASSSKCRQQ